MDSTTRRAGALIAATLLLTVITQVIYVAALNGVGIVEGWPLRSTLWTAEVVAFTVMAVAALGGLARDPVRPFLWSALAVSALVNAIQAGVGLSLFLPLTEAGENFAPVMGATVAGAFLFYFLAKLVLGLAAILLGLELFREGSIVEKIAGALSLLTGLAAALLNLAALRQSLDLTFAAGATGTAAALFTAIALLLVMRRQA